MLRKAYECRAGSPAASRDDDACLAVRIIDFGCSQMVSPHSPPPLRGLSGSPLFLAPEIVNGHCYGHPADVWALGVTLYYLASGRLPFWTEPLEYLDTLDTEELNAGICANPVSRLRALCGVPEVLARLAGWAYAGVGRRSLRHVGQMGLCAPCHVGRRPRCRVRCGSVAPQARGLSACDPARVRPVRTQVIFGGPRWRHVSGDLTHLLVGLLAKDPAKRLTAEQAMQVRAIVGAASWVVRGD